MAPTPMSLQTATGRIEGIKFEDDREGQFHTQAFERYSRYERAYCEIGLAKFCLM